MAEVDLEVLKQMAHDGGTRHMIATPQIRAIIAVLERAERLEAAVRAWDQCGCVLDTRCPHEEAVLDALAPAQAEEAR